MAEESRPLHPERKPKEQEVKKTFSEDFSSILVGSTNSREFRVFLRDSDHFDHMQLLMDTIGIQ